MGNICQTSVAETERNREVNTDMNSKRNQPEQFSPEESQPVEESSEQDEVKQDVSFISQNEVQRREKKKLAQIDAIGEQEVIYENVTKKEKKKSPFDYQVILNGLLSHFVFAQLQEDDQ